MDLLTYARTTEQELEHSSALAYARNDVDGAIGYVRALAELLGVKLPQRPMQARSYMTNNRVSTRYYFLCLNIVAQWRNRDIKETRARYGKPFVIKAAATTKAA